jgi:hypothetical protein
MQDVAQQATGRIITHHISPYHAVQGTEDEVRRIVGQPRQDITTQANEGAK